MADYPWATFSDEELLKLRICDLKIQIEGSELEERVKVLYSELDAKGLRFRPKTYLGDEWFSPSEVPSIAIPFYLAHPRLKALEQTLMLEVEGGTADWCLKLLRHESGHCFDHAYRFSKRKKWTETFGSPKQHYDPDTYRPRPYSRSFVRHIDNWYAQAHPDEDFAETFAVWLAPLSNWESHYKEWPLALKKLEYIDSLAREVKDKDPLVKGGPHISSAARLKSTLEMYYTRRKKERAQDYPDFYDADLKKIFTGDPSLPKREHSAERFMHKNRKIILDSVSRWTGEKKYTVNSLVKKLTSRCESLNLRVSPDSTETGLQVAAYLATLVTNYLFTGKFKRTV